MWTVGGDKCPTPVVGRAVGPVDERSRRTPDRCRLDVMTEPSRDHPDRPVVATQADLEQMWRRLMEPLGFSGFSLWLVIIRGDRAVPKVMEFTELPDSPEKEDTGALAKLLALLATPDTRFAFLRSRPGGGRPSAGDRAWALALYAAGRDGGARIDVVHLAHDHDVLPLTVDDLMAESA
jgi:hypothetical protein